MKKIDEKGRWKFNAMIINTKNIFRVAYGLATTALLLNCLAGCKKYANPAGVYENYNQTKTADSSVSRRILIVSIDGAVGVEVKKLVQSNSLPNISALIQHSKYTYNGLADPNTNDATTWATMATGVRPNKHGIFDDSFLPSLDVNNPHKALAFYPTMFYWLLQSRPTFKTVSISTLASIKRVFIGPCD